MKYKVGDKVRIKSLDWYNENKDANGDVLCFYGVHKFTSNMSKYCGKIVTISTDITCDGEYFIKEDGETYWWTDEMIEGLPEEETKPEPRFKVGDEVIAYAEGCLAKFSIKDVRWNRELNKFEYKICSSWYDASVIQLHKEADNFLIERVDNYGVPFSEWLSHKGSFYVPDGYELKDENGNVINATKIVLEKKKKEYPKTYEECCNILHAKRYHGSLLETLQKLLIARDAYWKIAGEEMGLGKPWEPSGTKDRRYILRRAGDEILKGYNISCVLEFPTAEMRDAFYENFKELIEQCKELL